MNHPELDARNGKPFNRHMAERLRSHREDVAALESAQARQLEKLHAVMMTIPGMESVAADVLALHAESIRDALEPWDSGTRPAADAA